MHSYLEEVFGEVLAHGVECVVSMRNRLENF